MKGKKIEQVQKLLHETQREPCYLRVYKVHGDAKVLVSETPINTDRCIEIIVLKDNSHEDGKN